MSGVTVSHARLASGWRAAPLPGGVEPSGSLWKVSSYFSILLSRTSPVARAVYNNRTRLLSGVARQAFKLRPNWWNAASFWFSIVAACAGPGYAAETMCRSAIWSTLPGTTRDCWCDCWPGRGRPESSSRWLRLGFLAILRVVSWSSWYSSPPAISAPHPPSWSDQSHTAEYAISQRAVTPVSAKVVLD